MKVLLLSHNPVTTYNNMGKTFLSLFSAFRPEELCQLFLYPAVPDTACCGSYYRFTDREALHSIWDRHAVGGEISPDPACHDKFTSEKEERTYRSPRSRSEPMRLARDLIWQLSRWDHPGLKAWLDRERPDVLFVAPGKQELLYDIALTLARERHIPIVSYICDDFYFLQEQNAFWAKLRQKRLRRKIAALLQETALTVTICPELAARYHESFGAEVTDVMTCPPFAVHPYTEPGRDVLHRCLTYMGNLGCGRGQPLLERLEAHYGVKPILYVTYRSYYRYIAGGGYGDYPIWCSSPTVFPLVPGWDFWQYSHSAELEGYYGTQRRIDLNIFRGSQAEFERFG